MQAPPSITCLCNGYIRAHIRDTSTLLFPLLKLVIEFFWISSYLSYHSFFSAMDHNPSRVSTKSNTFTCMQMKIFIQKFIGQIKIELNGISIYIDPGNNNRDALTIYIFVTRRTNCCQCPKTNGTLSILPCYSHLLEKDQTFNQQINELLFIDDGALIEHELHQHFDFLQPQIITITTNNAEKISKCHNTQSLFHEQNGTIQKQICCDNAKMEYLH